MPKLWSSSITSYYKKPEFLGDVADSKFGVGTMQDGVRTSCPTKQKRCCQRLKGSCQKDSAANFKKFLLAKNGTTWVWIKIRKAMSLNPLNTFKFMSL